MTTHTHLHTTTADHGTQDAQRRAWAAIELQPYASPIGLADYTGLPLADVLDAIDALRRMGILGEWDEARARWTLLRSYRAERY